MDADLLLLCSTAGEGAALARRMGDARRTERAGKETLQGALDSVPCRLTFTGMGAVNTASALTSQLERQRPVLVVQLGIAGAYVPAGLPVGALACATEEIYGDVGVLTPEGWQPADLIGIPLVAGDPPRFNRFPLDPELVARAAAMTGAAAGPFLTLGQCTGVRARADELHARFGALCETMEGAAAAHVCALYGVPFLEVRGVSNLVEDRNRDRWDIPRAAAAAQEAVLRLVENVDRLVGGPPFSWKPHDPEG